MKSFVTMAVAVLAVLLLSSGGLLVTHAQTPSSASDRGQGGSSQALSLTATGGVLSAGNQHYLIVQHGQTLEAVVNGDPLVTSHLTYVLNAQQNGLTTSGRAVFTLTGQDATGATITVTGIVQISGNIPAVCLPSFTSPVACSSPDTSEVPALFVGAASMQVTTQAASSSDNGNGNGNGNGDNVRTQDQGNHNAPVTAVVPMYLESAYMNPFGAPIGIASFDPSTGLPTTTLVIVTTYTKATIDWSNVQDLAALSGTLGSVAVTGTFSQVAQEHEDLVAGTAQDQGSLTFSGMSVPSLDATGTYTGTSTIPTSPSFDCSAQLGFPCTVTGFQSSGDFNMNSQGPNSVQIAGTYS
ncbi:MAG: hypothetical protein ACYCPP_07755, partial [Nitrososphaerales archaeon]